MNDIKNQARLKVGLRAVIQDGQLQLPKELIEELNLKPDDELEFIPTEEGEIILQVVGAN